MATVRELYRGFINNRWLVFVVSIWVQSCAGVVYLFGRISPVIKTTMGYNQRQVAMLGVAKNLGDSVGIVAGSLSEVLPFWALLAIGAVQDFVGYGSVWLIVSGRLPKVPLWMLCIAIFVGTNGDTYFNTASLVSNVQNFPKSRGPIVGILKGFAGLSGAILSQIYRLFESPDPYSFIIMVAVVPAVVVLSLMFIVRTVDGHRQIRPSDSLSFTFVYAVCLALAAYLMGILLLENLTDLSESWIMISSIILFSILLLPLLIPVVLAFLPDPNSPVEESLLAEPQTRETSKCEDNEPEILFSDVESEVESENYKIVESGDRRKRIAELQAKLVQAAADGGVRIKKRKGPRRGENFSLRQALMKADFWLLFFVFMIAAGCGVTIIDNLGQICESLGYKDARVFVSMISIWNFLGRVGGGYFSELVVRNYAYPRPIAMAIFQVIMMVGLLYYAMGWPAAIYVVTVLAGLGYGAHWAIVPATISELFGLKSFGALYNFMTLGMPAGSFLCSGLIAGHIYDYYAEKQAAAWHPVIEDDTVLTCNGLVCFSLTCAILSGLILIAVLLSLIVVYRTRSVYAQLYAKALR